MRIKSLQISGFKGYEPTTNINFLDENGTLIFDTDGQERIFIFEAILGIIFGFTPEEKKKFRGDQSMNQTFTGLVTLSLDQKTVFIERDFETDIIACLLSDSISSRPIFQGKDLVGNGYSRPYLDMLRSIFPIVDKSLYLEILWDEINEGKSLSNLLNALYLLFSPRFNLNRVRSLISKSEEYLRSWDVTQLDSKSLSQLALFKDSLIFLKSIHSMHQQLKEDQKRLQHLMEKIRRRDMQKNDLLKKLEESYQAIMDQNPILLRAEILLWKSLSQMKEKNQKELKDIRRRIDEIEQTLQLDFREYNQLPDSVERIVKQFEEDIEKANSLRKKIKNVDIEIKMNEMKYNTWRTIKILFIALITPISFVLSYIAFSSWFLIIPEAFFFFLIFFFLFGHYHSKIREKLLNLKEDKDIYRKHLFDIEKGIEALRRKWFFLKDSQNFNLQREQLYLYQQLQLELKQLKREEERISQILNQTNISRQLKTFQEKYSSMVDVHRPDLEAYLDEFVQLKNQLASIESSSVEPPMIQELQKIIEDYKQALKQLKTVDEDLSERLHLHQYNLPIDQILDAVKRRIKNLQMQRGIQFEY